jgi:hypothetical protein
VRRHGVAVSTLSLGNVGPSKIADVEFGDLTVLVGPQATGKTVFLELLKLVHDTGYVHGELSKHGYEWSNDLKTFLDIYLGEGMHTVWSSRSSMSVDGKLVELADYVHKRNRSKSNYVFYIPAQRVVTLASGWPRPFQAYSPEDPFVVRDFSERFRVLMTRELNRTDAIFPKSNRLKSEYRDLLRSHVFGDYELRVETHGAQKRLVLQRGKETSSIPFMTWSAGQREFVPLLMGLYWLLPAAKVATRDKIRWVVIEELEMGLHPSAISSALLLVLELLVRGYKVCLSTHSQHVLDVVWAMGVLKDTQADPDLLLDIFRCAKTQQTRAVAKEALRRTLKVYFFDGDSGSTVDISKLDPGSSDSQEAGWGGIAGFSGRVAEIVARAVRA